MESLVCEVEQNKKASNQTLHGSAGVIVLILRVTLGKSVVFFV